eukprot:COSAG01_NODE_7336_length_3244_cov_18.910970_5_plen_167_part_01
MLDACLLLTTPCATAPVRLPPRSPHLMSSPAADATDAADAAADLLSLFEGAQPTPQAGAPSAVASTTRALALSNDRLTAAPVPDASPIANPAAGRIAGRIWQNLLNETETDISDTEISVSDRDRNHLSHACRQPAIAIAMYVATCKQIYPSKRNNAACSISCSCSSG